MTPLRYTAVLPVLALVLAAPVAQERVRYRDGVYPCSFPVERGEEEWLACRVADGVTGAAIAGAELFLVRESETPLAGEFWFTRKATADGDGFVRVRLDDIEGQWHWIVVRAPGYGPGSSMHVPDDLVWRLMPGVDLPVRIRDWRGRPAGGALVGFCGGCGHSPDLANAATGPDGIALLRGIDPHNDIGDLYVQAPGLGLGYEGFTWYPGDPPVEIDCQASVAITGKLVGPGGPIAGAFVGTRQVHRGPWARTTADGSFRVLGAGLDEDLIALLPGREIYFERPEAFPALFRVPEPDGQPVQDGEVVAPAAAGRRTEPVPPAPIPVLRIAGGAPDEPAVSLRVPGKSRDVTEAVAGGEVEVPGRGPFCFVLSDGETRRYFAFDSKDDLPAGPLELRWYPPTVVRAAVTDSTGAPVAVRAAIRPWAEAMAPPEPGELVRFAGGQLLLRAHHIGLSVLHLEPERPGLYPRRVLCTLPARGDRRRLDLGVLALSDAPLLTVLDAGGRPLAGASVRLSRPGLHPAGDPPAFELDEGGRWQGPDLRSGDVVVIETDGDAGPGAVELSLPFRSVLRGDGPWTVRLPGTTVEVHATDEGGAPIEAVLFAADRATSIDGQVRLRHVAPGRHRWFLVAPGRRTAEVTLRAPAQGKAELRIALPRQ